MVFDILCFSHFESLYTTCNLFGKIEMHLPFDQVHKFSRKLKRFLLLIEFKELFHIHPIVGDWFGMVNATAAIKVYGFYAWAAAAALKTGWKGIHVRWWCFGIACIAHRWKWKWKKNKINQL